MKISDLKDKLGYNPLWEDIPAGEIKAGYTSDLLSDVMGNGPDDSVLITIQAHKNTVAVASLAGINSIVLCNKRMATEDMIEAAREENIALFNTKDNQFTASWKIHSLLEE